MCYVVSLFINYIIIGKKSNHQNIKILTIIKDSRIDIIYSGIGPSTI